MHEFTPEDNAALGHFIRRFTLPKRRGSAFGPETGQSLNYARAPDREALHGYAQLRANDTGFPYFVTGAGQALLDVPENRRAADETLGGIVAVYRPRKLVR